MEAGVRGLSAFLYTVAGIVFGGIVSAVVSYYFARQASRELQAETDNLTHLITAVLQALDASGIEVRKDPGTDEYIVRISKDLHLGWRDQRHRGVEGESDAESTPQEQG